MKSFISNSVFLFEVFTIKNNIKTVKLFVFCKFLRKSLAQWSKEPQKIRHKLSKDQKEANLVKIKKKQI